MHLDIYRSKKFEKNSALWDFDSGTFMYRLSADGRDISEDINKLWTLYEKTNAVGKPNEMECRYDDWQPLSKFELNDDSDYYLNFGDVVKRSEIPKLADHIYSALDKAKDLQTDQIALRASLAKHVRCILCLSRPEVSRTEVYLSENRPSIGVPNQGHINNIISNNMSKLLPRLVFKQKI